MVMMMRRQSRNDDGSRKVELDVKDEECEERDDGQEGGDCSKEEYESSKGDEGRENLGHDDDKENYSEEGDDDEHNRTSFSGFSEREKTRSGVGSQVTTVYCNYGSKNKVEKRERQKESGRCEVPSVAERRFNTVSNIKKLKRKR